MDINLENDSVILNLPSKQLSNVFDSHLAMISHVTLFATIKCVAILPNFLLWKKMLLSQLMSIEQ